MEFRLKLSILADAAKYDASCASSGSQRRAQRGALGDSNGVGICHSYTPDGRCVSLLKILLTNYCIYNCRFCVNRVTSDTPRARLQVEEVVRLTIDFYRRNYIEGLFLSSGIIQSPDYTMEQLTEVARRLREVERFNGYIHLKAIPGAAPELIDRAARYADRLSANIELPTEADLRTLAPEKQTSVVEATMGEIRARHDEGKGSDRRSFAARRYIPAGQSTQMIVGATPSSDRDILNTASRLYRAHRLKRVYYSAFSPIDHADHSLPQAVPPLVREHRLYQADWLVRYYGFKAGELTSEASPNLDLTVDPKHAWAMQHPEFFPVDVNAASKEALLRVPGLGRRNVLRLLQIRRLRKVRLADLQRLRVPLRRCRSFIVAADHSPKRDLVPRAQRFAIEHGALVVAPSQLMLFESAAMAHTGEL